MTDVVPTGSTAAPSTPRPLRALLVANRGEIALRVIRSARARGLRTVAVFSDADRDAPHVRAADAAVHLGPTPATSSYLSVERIIDAARDSGADAVHPGYGFLSERAEFARAVTEAGLTFVGPSADVMDAMGRKDRAREIAERAGVPVVPRVEVVVSTGSTDAGAAVDAFPVLVKAASGGGGKGMRIVRDPAELEGALAAARREAASAFGDDTLLVERYVERGRHVEVQVLADSHGHVVHLFERDCSAQRRHQKVLEEAPAPGLSEAARRTLLDSAVALTREVGYENAGTVEFLVAGDEGSEEVYFLEMNTRLQVEHPVTELVVEVAGRPLDLVDLQLRVAAGEELGFTQDDVRCVGHAIEARVYAEDAFGGFLPQAGTASIVRWPASARVDAALESGQTVTSAYDPMLGKVIARGSDREGARQALVAALDRTAVLGLTTNTGFLRALAASDAFRDSQVDTAWLDRHDVAAPDVDTARVIAAWTDALVTVMTAPAGPFAPDGWRLGADAAPVLVELDRELVVDLAAGTVTDGGTTRAVTQLSAANHEVVLDLDGRRHTAVVNAQAHGVELSWRGQRFVFARVDPFAADGAEVGDGTLTAPMPGTVLAVSVAPGDRVEEGAELGVLEAMKMELTLRAPFAGSVAEVGAAAGDQVALGATLFVVALDEGEEG
ncbi:ATP-grasp domain-containing protein [Nocardioides sp. HDW12B]|uniref:acetyl/propionyl/methylcrotonyl-CoA carboxylase subunit alpha n=1 Tax=Nocardioides sp. HDW12B TaxID=2714939 RepID=UPI00140BE5CE|nr:biotin carboxylase N-terminal domain-containing protein [Nocardioides sp. HDW12B]QIK67850.1 ATP-grasp domain-containing protein [Nocardioides sp. HDW12B]